MKSFLNNFLSLLFVWLVFIQALIFSCNSENPSRILINKVKSILEEVSTYTYGKSRSWLQEYHDVMRQVYNMPEIHEDVEQLLLDILKSKASNEAKLLVCKSLGTMGGNSSIPVLKKMLGDGSTAYMALIALTTIPGEEIDKILVNYITEATVDQLIGIINTLALRKSAMAVPSINRYINNENPGISIASIDALGTIAGAEAAQLLHEAFLNNNDEKKWKIAEGLIKSVEDSEPELKVKYYKDIYAADPPVSIKYAAFKGIVEETEKNDQSDLILQTLNSSDTEFREALIPLIRNLPENTDMAPFIESVPALPETLQGQLILALADRKVLAVRPLAIKWVQSEITAKRLIGLKCLESVSQPGDIPLLAGIAARSTGVEMEYARACLYWMAGDDVNTEIINSLKSSGDVIKPELIRCAGYRKIVEANELVYGFLMSNNTRIRSEAIETMGKIGTKDDLNQLLDWVVDHATKPDIDLIEESVTAIALNYENHEEVVALLDQTLKNTVNEVSKIIVIRVLGNISGDYSFRIIQPYASDKNRNIQFAALKVFSSWENDAPLTDLEQVIQSEIPQQNRSQAISGITYLVLNSIQLNEDQKSAKLESTFAYANTELDKKIMINGFSKITSMKSLDFVIQQLSDPSIQNEVQDAIIRIAGNLRSLHEVEIQSRMDSLMQHTESDEFREKIDILQKSMEL